MFKHTYVRRNKAPLAATLAAMVTLVLAAPAAGQTDSAVDAGFQRNRGYWSPESFEHIDTLNGNLVLTFTDLVLPGNAGRDLRFQRTYNSRLADSGWALGIAGVVMNVDFGAAFSPDHPDRSLPSLRTADGAVHSTIWMNSNSPSSNPEPYRWVVTAEFWRYDRTGRKLYMPDGTICSYDATGHLVEIRDPFNNLVSLNWDADALRVIQQLGNGQSREIVIAGMSSGFPSSLSFAGRSSSYEWIPTGSILPERELHRVVPPVGGAWEYTYDAGEPSLVRTLTTPAGGQLAYTYGIHQFSHEQRGQVQVNSRVVASRSVVGDERPWTYAYQNYTADDPCACESTMITTPGGTRVGYWNSTIVDTPYVPSLGGDWGLKVQRVTDVQGQVLETEVRDYTTKPVVDYIPAGGTAELQRRSITRDGQQYVTTFDYAATNFGDYHRPNVITESGPTGLTRTTTRGYDYAFNMQTNGSPYFNGKIQTETVTVRGEPVTRSWGWNHNTGFLQTETAYGITTSFDPDGSGNVVRTTKANGTATSYTYSYGVVKDTMTQAHTVSREINPDGTLASEKRGNRTTSFKYDDLFRVIKITPPGSNETNTEYDNPPGTVKVTRGSSVTTTSLDGFGRPIQTMNSLNIIVHTRYDVEGRKVYEGYPFDPGATSGNGNADIGTSISYDGLGRVVERRNPDNTFAQVKYAKDGPGTVTLTDENNHATVQTWEGFGTADDGRLVTVKDPDGFTWSYAYTVLGRLALVNAPGGTQRVWTYDSAKPTLLRSEKHPESGTTSYIDYDLAGNLKSRTDGNGTQFLYEYDGNDRLSKVTAGDLVTTFTYEAGTDNRASASLGDISSSFTYDGAGRLQQRDDSTGFMTKFEYYDNDNLKTIQYPTGRRIHYDYDLANRITAVNDETASRPYAAQIKYHPSGAIASYVAGNGITHSTTFAPNRYWVTGISAGDLQLTYRDYDDVGNVQTIVDNQSGVTQTFTYDKLDRLWTANGYAPIAYTYDAHGNRNDAVNIINPSTLRLDAWNGMAFTYDNNGNLKSVPNASYTYTAHNMLATATAGGTTTAYSYDADLWRMKKTNGNASSYYIRGPHGELLTEWQNPAASGWTVKDYVYVGSALIASVAK